MFLVSVASGAPLAARCVNRTPVLREHTMSVREWHTTRDSLMREVSNATTLTSLALETGIRYLTEQLSYLSLILLMVVMRDLCRESWVPTLLEVLHRFHDHISQRRHLCQPKHLLCSRRLKFDVKLDVFR